MLNLDAAVFARIRTHLFGGHLLQPQVDGIKAIVMGWNGADVRQLAYCLATAYHETGRAMQPIEEIGKGQNRPYGQPDKTTGKTYYGRGLVQLTWIVNYARLGRLLNLDLTNRPELALDMGVAVKIMFEGMTRGIFTGKGLGAYFNDTVDDPYNARRIINGIDCADLIADYHDEFLAALQLAHVP